MKIIEQLSGAILYGVGGILLLYYIYWPVIFIATVIWIIK